MMEDHRHAWRIHYSLPETDPRWLDATDEMIARDLLLQSMRNDDSERIEQGRKAIENTKQLWVSWLGEAAARFEEARREARAPSVEHRILTPRRD